MRTQATVSIPLPRSRAEAFGPYTVLVFVLAMLFGGGTRQGLWSDVIVQLAALPLLAWALLNLALRNLRPVGRWSIVLVGAIIVLPLSQLIPLPPAIWTSLPGRGEIISAYQAAGMRLPWLTISLDPAATWRSLLSLIPAISIFFAMLSLERPTRRIIVAVIFVFAAVSVLLDLMQVMGGSESPLRFYVITNPDRAVGLFANANHHAALLYAAIAFAASWLITLARDPRRSHPIQVPLLLLVLVAGIIGLALSHSRAGLALGFLVGLCCLVMIWRFGPGRSARRLWLYGLGANLVGLLIAFQFGFVALATKAENASLIEDIRWPVASVTAQAARANLPLGTGYGTFVPVYDMFAPRTLLRDYYVNHAHDDWLELLLTGGIPAVILEVLFLIWFSWASISVWRRRPPDGPALDVMLARAASIVIALLLLHSLVDYPLRTAALTVVFAIACALLISGGARTAAEVSAKENADDRSRGQNLTSIEPKPRIT